MRSIFASALLIVLSTQTFAGDAKFVNADGSASSQLCIAAVDSYASIYQVAKEMGVSRVSVGSLRCNDMSLRRFVNTYQTAPVVEMTTYSFNKSDDSVETEICIAAVTSSEDFVDLKQAHFSGRSSAINGVRCNDMSLDRFVDKYSTGNFTASI